MKNFFKKLWTLIKRTVDIFNTQDPIVYAAAIAFFTIFSMPSVLIILVQTLGTILGEEEVRNQLANQITGFIGTASTEEILTIIENRSWENSSIVGNIIGIVSLFISATAIFGFIQKALNSTWNVKPAPDKVVKRFVIDRLLSFSMIIVMGFLLLVSLLIDTVLAFFRDFLHSVILDGVAAFFVGAVNIVVSMVVVSGIFALIFKYLPDAKIKWKDVTIGAIVTGALFTLGKNGIGLILSQTQITSTYGAAGSLAGILVWVFYSSVLVLVGAAFTKAYSEELGHRIRPQNHAKKLKKEEKEAVEG